MAKRNNKLKRKEELEAFDEGIFDSVREVVPTASRHFDISDMFKNYAQRAAYSVYEQHDVVFLLGPAGTGKTFCGCMFAINELVRGSKSRIILTRPIVEAGESLGYLPGTFSEKTDPYMMPLYDCIRKLVPIKSPLAVEVQDNTEVAPIAYLRGRSQPLDEMVLTPLGFKQMGDIKLGDEVIGSDGNPTEVLGVYPQGELDVYRVWFTDKSSVECSGDHLWSTMTLNEKRHKKGFSVKTTKQIKDNLKTRFNQKIHKIPMTFPVKLKIQNSLPIEPYVLGVYLGDGNSHKHSSVSITNKNEEIIEQVGYQLPVNMLLKLKKDKREYATPSYDDVVSKDKKNLVRRYLSSVGLLGLRSYEKFVPWEYLHSSVEDRLELLKGLMDTDGSVFLQSKGKPRVQYYSTSFKLANAVKFLINSLGGTAIIKKRDYDEDDVHEYKGSVIRHCCSMYVVDIQIVCNPFKVSVKADLFKPGHPKRLVSKVEYVGKKQCQCIRVAAKDSLYLTNDFIVTHNTLSDSVCILDEAQNCSWSQLLLYLTRLGENSKMVVTGDPTQSDIGRDSALMDVVHRLDGLDGIGVVKFTDEHIVRHKLVGQIIKRLERNF